MSITDYYKDELIILESTKEQDHGILKKTWNEINGSDFKGKIILLSANEFKSDNSNNYNATHKLVCSITVNLNRHNRVKDKNTNTFYEIVWIKQVQTNHKKVLLKEVTHG